MAAPHRYSHAEVKAGLFLAFCVALFAGMLLVYGKVSRFWRTRQEIHVMLSSIGGLLPDATVRYNGVEVGRVKHMRIVHLDPAQLRRLVPLSHKDLDDLPLAEAQRKELRLLPDAQFDAKVKEALRDKTLIELTLEVLQEGQIRRYLTDDGVRVLVTILGDTFIDVVSGPGHGLPLGPQDDVVLFGTSGEFFSHLSRSMDQVKDVLSSVTDVVGGPERAAFKRASARLTGIIERMDALTDKAEERMPASSGRFTAASDAGRGLAEQAKKVFNDAKAQGAHVKEVAVAARKDVGQHVTAVREEFDKAQNETRTSLKAIAKDVRESWDAATPHLEQMKAEGKALAKTFCGVADRAESIEHTGGRLGEQSAPELLSFAACMKQGFKNLSSLRYIREKTDQLIGKGDKGEHEFWTALETYRGLRRIARWLRDVAEDLGELRTALAAAKAPPVSAALQDVDAAGARVATMREQFDGARDATAAAFLPEFQGSCGTEIMPPFPRKRAGRQPAVTRW